MDYKVAYESDLIGSITGLLRLQKMYNLSTTELSKGIINGVQYRDELSMEDCFQISVVLIENKEFEMARQWLYEAYYKPESKFTNFEVNTIDVLENLAIVFNATGM
jgi:hypothetical protein